MNVNDLNKRLKNVDSEEQLSLLFFKTNRKMHGVLHGKEVAIITIKDGYARYSYVDSEIKGYCTINKLYQYLTF
ncbi:MULTISPECIES: hypothetical protein [Cytobacillus]|uniref:Uncharacterized protein n=1 Tax=Cytobacillus oceanisediminis TaxID=665099 RepID=A0ABX3CNM4_9BACI|nr:MULTISPECIES: hypothetical protein [Cytobacillus]OHX44775.1 hypothetical protein BBV17_25050 [Cytobacillus oceanisediminis]